MQYTVYKQSKKGQQVYMEYGINIYWVLSIIHYTTVYVYVYEYVYVYVISM